MALVRANFKYKTGKFGRHSVPEEEMATSKEMAALSISGSGPRPASLFIVIGLFRGELAEPVELCVRIMSKDTVHFLPIAKKHIMSLRRRQAIPSFRTFSGFGLYEVGTGNTMLSSRLLMYSSVIQSRGHILTNVASRESHACAILSSHNGIHKARLILL